MIIGGVEPSSVLDYPGFLSCVFFCQGCNFDCFYCHNRALIGPGMSMMSHQMMHDFLEKRKDFLQAVVFSGGECTLQQDLLLAVSGAKCLGFLTKIDTNGSNPGMLTDLLTSGMVDYVALDVKAPWYKYPAIVGTHAKISQVEKSLVLLLAHAVNHEGFTLEVRTTLAPGLDKDDLLALAKELPLLPLWTLNRYRKPVLYKPEDETRVNLPSLQEQEVAALSGLLSEYQPNLKPMR